MKHIYSIVMTMSFVIMIGFSCTKTNTHKVSQKWKIIQFSSVRKYMGSDGDYYTDTRTEDENSYTTTSVSLYGTNESVGSINENTLTINKDGTWSSSKSISFNEKSQMPFYDLNANITYITEKSGFWHFLSKNKKDGEGFIKNEKITFYTLKEKWREIEDSHYSFTGPQPDSTLKSTKVNEFNYEDSDNFKTYIVEESKKDLLKLKIVSSSSYGENNSQNDIFTYDVSISLKKQ